MRRLWRCLYRARGCVARRHNRRFSSLRTYYTVLLVCLRKGSKEEGGKRTCSMARYRAPKLCLWRGCALFTSGGGFAEGGLGRNFLCTYTRGFGILFDRRTFFFV